MYKTPAKQLLCSATMVGLTCVVMIGCSSQKSWDQEYTCSGQERSSTFVQGQPNNEKVYPMAVDFHIRSELALVKSYQVRLATVNENRLEFASKTGAFWVSGNFAPKTGMLEIIEGRTIAVDGVPQETRIAGLYNCRKKGGDA